MFLLELGYQSQTFIDIVNEKNQENIELKETLAMYKKKDYLLSQFTNSSSNVNIPDDHLI